VDGLDECTDSAVRHGRTAPMRLICNICALALLAATLVSVRAGTDGQQLAQDTGRPLLGMPAPPLVLKTIDGATIDLGQLYGRQAVYLKFWATWCVPCREQMPHFEHAYETAGSDVAVVAVNIGFNDTLVDVRDYERKVHMTMPIVIDDGRLAAAFHLRVTPQHVVIGRDGRILYVGHLADARLDAALQAARSGAASAPGPAAAAPAEIEIVRLGVGDSLPQEARRTLKGNPFALYDPRDPRPTVLLFLSPWCESYLATTRPEVAADCRRMRQQVAALKHDPGVRIRWLGVASGLWATADDLKAYQREFHTGIPLTLDESGRDFRTFDVTQVPTALIVDAHGRILRKVVGDQFSVSSALRAAVSSL
jgi:thiol-disulfide isomerase/thioredoxin